MESAPELSKYCGGTTTAFLGWSRTDERTENYLNEEKSDALGCFKQGDKKYAFKIVDVEYGQLVADTYN